MIRGGVAGFMARPFTNLQAFATSFAAPSAIAGQWGAWSPAVPGSPLTVKSRWFLIDIYVTTNAATINYDMQVGSRVGANVNVLYPTDGNAFPIGVYTNGRMNFLSMFFPISVPSGLELSFRVRADTAPAGAATIQQMLVN
jgi:hypothetical protein